MHNLILGLYSLSLQKSKQKASDQHLTQGQKNADEITRSGDFGDLALAVSNLI
jgi:hypothetical protein